MLVNCRLLLHQTQKQTVAFVHFLFIYAQLLIRMSYLAFDTMNMCVRVCVHPPQLWRIYHEKWNFSTKKDHGNFVT